MPIDRQTSWVPLRWPSAWKDAATLELLAGTPVNCVLFGAGADPALRSAAGKAGLATVDWSRPQDSGVAAAPLAKLSWTSPYPVFAVTDAAWPGVRPRQRGSRDDADSGPTGAPWVDANGWVAGLVRARAPHKAIWLASDPPAKNVNLLRPEAYLLALADAAAGGARWPLALDEEFARDLAAHRPESLAQWKLIATALAFFESHPAWAAYETRAALAVISSFSGTSEYLGAEILNLAARRNLAYRVMEKTRAAAADFGGLKAILYVDASPPVEPLRKKLEAFVLSGGLLIAPSPATLKLSGGQAVETGVAGYQVRAFEKGRIATPVKAWEDPYQVAADAHSLVSRRNDPVRLFNAGTVSCRCSVALSGGTTLLELVNYSARAPAHAITVALEASVVSARVSTLENPAPARIEPVRSKHGVELPLPPFAVWAAVELNPKEASHA